MTKWVDWDLFRERQNASLPMTGKPHSRDNDGKRINSQRPQPPRVGVMDRDDRKEDRADDRDEENDPDREDDREDVDSA